MTTSINRLIKFTAFSLFLLIFILLLSYKVNLFLADKTMEQQQTIDYLQGKTYKMNLALNFTEDERAHLDDVKQVVQKADYLFYLSLIILLFLVLFNYKNKAEFNRLLKIASITTLIFLGIILIFTLLSFNFSFAIFHSIFFPQGNWQFAADSLLIKTFPLEFFVSLSWKIFVTALLLAGLVLFIVRKK